MSNMVEIGNVAKLEGYIHSAPVFSHEIYKEKFYTVVVDVIRTSGVSDLVPVAVSERLIDIDSLLVGSAVAVSGRVRSYNERMEDGRSKLRVQVFANEISEIENPEMVNEIKFEGYICKAPNKRETPLGRIITDCMIAVNRPYGKSDYIPCIFWGRNAEFVAKLPVGTRCGITGRFQSRVYQKDCSEQTTYEISISSVYEA